VVTSCFFCQNLLSDFIEGILPSSRHEELKRHLESCRDCAEVHRDLSSTLELLHALPPRPLSADMALRITEACVAGRAAFFTSRRISQFVLFLSVPALLFAGAVVTFPKLFPWATSWRAAPDQARYVKYFPLLQGASEIIEEQSNWLHVREPYMRSLWEEGGLTPEEFEKDFQGKPSKAEGRDEGSGDSP
jgi:hypothetical protein